MPVLESDGTIGGPLRSLARLRRARSRRAPSCDRTSSNQHYVWVRPSETVTLLETEGAGGITHIWMTSACQEPLYLRRCVLHKWCEGEPHPSVEVPLGDIFSLRHAETRTFTSLPLAMTPQSGRGMVCYFPMPFSSRAVVSLTSECSSEPVR